MSDKEIFFLIRAYNDLDTQLPLIDAFAQDKRFRVRVIGYPCDGFLGIPQSHEAAKYFQAKYGLPFETVLDSKDAPLFMRALFKGERIASGLRRGKAGRFPVVAQMLKLSHLSMLHGLKYLFSRSCKWLEEIARNWKPWCIITDEAVAQKGRSCLGDVVLPRLVKTGTPVYIVKTGHDIYYDPFPNKAHKGEIRYQPTGARRFLVPGRLDKNAAEISFPSEKIEVHGNLRMSPAWVEKLHMDVLISPNFPMEKVKAALPPGAPRVVFMLSKLGYGIDVDALKETLRQVCNIPGIACAIKPHTRGMKFDFMSVSELGTAMVVDDIPSPALIDWADIVLFTGSSIVFHASERGKRVGFLNYCQDLETIFDDGLACDRFDSLKQLTTFIEEWRDHGAPILPPEEREKRKHWHQENVYPSSKEGNVARHYKALVLSDIFDK